jgi:hypothetical protein
LRKNVFHFPPPTEEEEELRGKSGKKRYTRKGKKGKEQ